MSTHSPSPSSNRRQRARGSVAGRDLPAIPTGLATLTLRALGGPNKTTSSIRLEDQDLYRLEQVKEFLDSASRGSQGLQGLAASRKALVASPGNRRSARYPTMSQDVATGKLVKELLGVDSASVVVTLAKGMGPLLKRMRSGAEPTANERDYIDGHLKPFLYRLAQAEDHRYDSVPGRHILRA